MRILPVLILLFCCQLPVIGQNKRILSLEEAIRIASDSTILSFRSKYEYQRKVWEYNLFKANRRPQVELNFSPYYAKTLFSPEVDYIQITDNDYFLSRMEVEMRQKLLPLGGYFYASTRLAYQKFLSGTTPYVSTENLFGVTPLLVGYRHELLGYNEFWWEERLSSLQFEKAAKEFLYELQQIIEQAVFYFFQVASAEAVWKMTEKNAASSDTIYQIGKERFAITSIKKEELLTLELQKTNAQNSLHIARLNFDKARDALLSFLNLDRNEAIETVIPERYRPLFIELDDAVRKAKENNPYYLQLKEGELLAEQYLDKTTREAGWQANLNVNIGVQQWGDDLGQAYWSPRRYTTGGIAVSLPLVDFGAAKSRKQIAQYLLEATRLTGDESERVLREDISNSLREFNSQQFLLTEAEKAISLADLSFEQVQQSYSMGQSDINTFTLSQSRKDEAYTNYITALQSYWTSYYKLRRLTLFDYFNNVSLIYKLETLLK